MATTIKLKNGSGAPTTGDLVQGEPAFDLTNKRLYTEDSGGSVIEVGTNPTSLTTGTFTSTGIDDNASSTAITIDSSGDVGINTASPNLHGWTKAVTLDTSSNAGYELGQSGTKYGAFALQADGRVQITNFTANPLTFQTNNTERMRIDSSGNVGLGTTSPNDTNGFSRALDVNGVNGAALYTRTNGSTTNQTLFGNFGDSGYINNKGSGSLLFYNNNNTERMRIDSSGNVGIGTTSPSFNSGSGLEISRANTCTLRVENTGTGASSAEFFAGNDKTVIGSTSNTHTEFRTNSIERMRLDSSGALFVGATSASSSATGVKIQPNGYGGVSAAVNLVGSSSINTNSGFSQYSTGAGAYRFYVDYAGTIFATSTSISAISDASLKENVRDLDKGLDTINALQPRRFDWKNGDGNDIMGFIAQEVEKVMPELVHEYKYSDEENKKGLKMGDMVPSMVKAIQELSAQVNELKAEVAALKGE